MANKKTGDRARAARLDVIRAELVTRVRPFCTAMPDELFLEMIDTMAEIQLKYELHSSTAPA